MIQILTKDEERFLLQGIYLAIRESEGFKKALWLRDLVMILLGLRCGFRVGEIQRLKISNVWFQEKVCQSIHVPANFNKSCLESWVHVAEDLREALEIYVPLRLLYAKPDERDPVLLVSRMGVKARNPLLSRPVVRHILERWRKKAGIRHIKFHALRHTFATRLLSDGGGNIRTVQTLLRHRSISSTMIYTHPGQDECDLAVQKAFNGAAKVAQEGV